MIIILSELQKDHLNILQHLSSAYLSEFCIVTLDCLSQGIDEKKSKQLADKLNSSKNDVENAIHALIFLFVEACKQNLIIGDFESSLALSGFSNEHQQIISSYFRQNQDEISECLYLMKDNDPIYQDLNWRLEVQVCSKNSQQHLKPNVVMDFVLATPKDLHNMDDKRKNKTIVNNNIDKAETASECQNTIEHVTLNCDLVNLVHLTDTLDIALKESKCQHVRKIQRSLK